MQMNNRKNIWERLSNASLVEGEQPTVEAESPWYIKLLLSVSGWFGAFFLLLFIGGSLLLMINSNIENYALLLVFAGAGLIFFSYNMFQDKQGDFLEHFILALSVAGQGMILTSLLFIFKYKDDELIFMALLQAFLMWAVPNYIHRMMSSFFMALSCSYFFFEIGMPSISTIFLTFAVAWLWINEFKWSNHKRVEAIAYGMTAALVFVQYSLLFVPYNMYEFSKFTDALHIFMYLVKLAGVLTLAYVVWKLLGESNKLHDSKVVMLSIMGLILLAISSFYVNGLMLGVLLLLIGFAHAHHLLTGLGIVSSLAFLSNYYYYTGETLIEKAGLLFLLGLGLILSRFVLKMVLKKEVSDV
jgi:uncharacterized membrane protein